MSYLRPKNDLEYSRWRLERILTSKRLIFNPYTVSDQRLMQIVERMGWGDEFDIVQAVVMNFTRLRRVEGIQEFDGIYATVGPCDGEMFIHAAVLTYGVTAFDSVQRERHMIGKRNITNDSHVAALEGKRVFVSRIIPGRSIRGYFKSAYRMTRLTGNVTKDSAKIRSAMCEAKIEMLRRILDHPDCSLYLDCSRNFFDYESRIYRAISIIQNWNRQV